MQSSSLAPSSAMDSRKMDTSEDTHLSNNDRFSSSTPTSAKFRQSVHMIPSPGSEGKPPKRFEPLIMTLPSVISTPLLMFILGAALEIAIAISNGNNGFKVPESNIFDAFGNVSPQFLASFFPTLLIMPFAFAWRELDWNIRWYQPYLVLLKGYAKAETSLLLDYVELGPFLSLFRAKQYKHHIVFWSSFTACLTYFFQPLTGSIFQIRYAPQTSTWDVTSTQTVGLAPAADVSDLNIFVAAAGYVDASVLYSLPDPPFVEKGWATAALELPSNPFLNGTLSVDTAGIDTNVNCSNPSEPPTLTPVSGSTFLNLTSKSIQDCVHSVQFDPSVATQQYGVDSVPCPGNYSSVDRQFQPVMFWFFHVRDDNNQSEVKTVFCQPTIAAFQVTVNSNLNNGQVINVTKVGELQQDNNVTGFGGLSVAQVSNGVVFDPTSNPFIDARANSTNSIVPGAIFRAALKDPNGLQATFNLPNGFLDLTSTLYTRHLATVAGSLYFVNQNSTLQGNVISLLPRLVIDPLPAHVLALILLVTGFIGVFIHVINRRKRKKLLLATAPGTIASIVALTARSGFGELLLPYDDEKTIERKLEGLRFRLDRRTGAIVAEDEVEPLEGVSVVGPDDATMSLLGNSRGKEDVESSTHLARQAASGMLPWDRSWAPRSSSSTPPPPSKTEYTP